MYDQLCHLLHLANSFSDNSFKLVSFHSNKVPPTQLQKVKSELVCSCDFASFSIISLSTCPNILKLFKVVLLIIGPHLSFIDIFNDIVYFISSFFTNAPCFLEISNFLTPSISVFLFINRIFDFFVDNSLKLTSHQLDSIADTSEVFTTFTHGLLLGKVR